MQVSGDTPDVLVTGDARHLLGITNANYFRELVNHVRDAKNSADFSALDQPVVFSISDTIPIEFTLSTDCPNGGTLYERVNIAPVVVRDLEYYIDDCSFNSITLNGYHSFFGELRHPISINKYELTYTYDQGSLKIVGDELKFSEFGISRLEAQEFKVSGTGVRYTVNQLKVAIGYQKGETGGDTVESEFAVTAYNGVEVDYSGFTDPVLELLLLAMMEVTPRQAGWCCCKRGRQQ